MGRNIYVAGYAFPIEWPTLAWFEEGGYNSHLLFCNGGPNPAPGGSYTPVPVCVPAPPFGAGIVPHNLKPGIAPHDFRFRRRRTMGSLGNPPAINGEYKGGWGKEALRAAQATVRQFCIHHDGCLDAQMTYHVLHNERGLSVHFILQNDGLIFQTLDLAVAGFQCKSLNETSIGIEMNNRGDIDRPGAAVKKTGEDYYEKGGGGKWAKYKRDIVSVKVNNSTIRSFGYTKEQVGAMHALDQALRRALPNLPPTYPQIAPGVQSWRTMDPWSLQSYSGWLGHYHETSNKWDPGPWDFAAFFRDTKSGGGGRKVFPLGLKEMPDPSIDEAKIEAQALKYYENNERGDSGFFPVGRWGDSYLWHTGIHLHVDKLTPVLCPFPGRVVAVRNGPESPSIGSVNFVLVKHEFSVGPALARFFSLYMHLARLGDPKVKLQLPQWAAGKPVDEDGTGDLRVTLYDEPVGEGSLLGYVGEAGPDDLRGAQLHFAVFSKENVGEKLGDGFWGEIIDGTIGRRLLKYDELEKLMDGNKDGKVSREELLRFFNESSDAQDMRNRALFAVSEWTELPDWDESLKSVVPDSASREDLIMNQIQPSLWWTNVAAKHAGLPKDGEVYHYHPITFIKWMNEKLKNPGTVSANGGIGHQDEAKGQTNTLLSDFDDVGGDSFVDESDFISSQEAADLTLEQLADGYPEK